jgi:hypothetical protein
MGTDDIAYGLDLVIDHGANPDQSLVDDACLTSIVEAKILAISPVSSSLPFIAYKV